MNETRAHLTKILWEIPIIVLAVFLALLVENIADERREKLKSDEALKAIWSEIEQNGEKLGADYHKNKEQLDRYASVRDSINQFGPEGFSMSLNYEHTLLSDAAWQRSILTGSTRRIDPVMVQRFSTIYELQELLSELGTTYFKQISSVEFHRDKDGMARADAMASLLQINHGIAGALLGSYEGISEGTLSSPD